VALDGETTAWLEQVRAAMPPDLFARPLPELRALLSGAPPGGPEPVEREHDREIDGPAGPLRLRVYHPGGDGPQPVLLWCHGGGFVLGGLDHTDGICRAIARAAGTLVVAVDFRLAPEHPCPAAVHDVAAATDWVLRHAAALGGDAERVVLGGDSSGGTLAAAACQLLRDRGAPLPAGQVLVYPLARLRVSTPEHADLPMMPAAAARRFWDLYGPAAPYAEPAAAADLAGLPPAAVLTAEADAGRDDAEDYALALARAGVRTVALRVPGTTHGFLGTTEALASSRAGLAEVCTALRGLQNGSRTAGRPDVVAVTAS